MKDSFGRQRDGGGKGNGGRTESTDRLTLHNIGVYHSCNLDYERVVNSITAENYAYSEYRALANILRSRYVARTPSVEARSPGRSSNVENAPRRRPVTGQPTTPTSDIWRAILRTPPSPASHRPEARTHPTERSHYVVKSRDGRKFVTRVRVMLP